MELYSSLVFVQSVVVVVVVVMVVVVVVVVPYAAVTDREPEPLHL